MTQSEQRLKLALVKAIETWVSKNCEGNDWPPYHFYNDQAEDMAEAAFHVFQVSCKAQEFYSDNK